MILKVIICTIILFIDVFSQNDFLEKKLETKSYINSIVCVSSENIFIGTSDNGIFVSKNVGESWESHNVGLPSGSIKCIAVTSNNTMFCGVSFNGHLLKGPDPLGVFRSTDSGKTWELVYESIWIHSIVIDSNDNIYVCGNTYDLVTDVVFSKDNGDNWEKIEGRLPNRFITEMIIDENENLFITRFEGGLYKLTNKGANWLLIRNEFIDNQFSKIVSNSNGILLAKIDTLGLYKSFDEGVSWRKIISHSQEEFIYDFAIKNNGDILVSNNLGLLFLRNNESTWKVISKNDVNRIIIKIFLHKSGYLFASKRVNIKELFAITPTGYELYKSKDILK